MSERVKVDILLSKQLEELADKLGMTPEETVVLACEELHWAVTQVNSGRHIRPVKADSVVSDEALSPVTRRIMQKR